MRQPSKSQVDFERIKKYDDPDGDVRAWIYGEIEDIKLEENRRTGFKDEKTGADKYVDQVRFKFKLDGHEYPHYSRWLTYSYGEKANLFLKYIKPLVAGAQPDLKFDLDLLKGFKIKTTWVANGDFDNLTAIRPAAGKFTGGGAIEPPEDDAPAEEVEDSPGVGE